MPRILHTESAGGHSLGGSSVKIVLILSNSMK